VINSSQIDTKQLVNVTKINTRDAKGVLPLEAAITAMADPNSKAAFRDPGLIRGLISLGADPSLNTSSGISLSTFAGNKGFPAIGLYLECVGDVLSLLQVPSQNLGTRNDGYVGLFHTIDHASKHNLSNLESNEAAIEALRRDIVNMTMDTDSGADFSSATTKFVSDMPTRHATANGDMLRRIIKLAATQGKWLPSTRPEPPKGSTLL
jgi:hypothetical protein